MSQKHKLHAIKNIANAKEQDEAKAKALAKIIERKTIAETKLVELVSFRQEYENKLKLNYAAEGAFINQLRGNRAFVEKLGNAIRQQQEQIKCITDELDTQIALWRSSHASHKALSSLLDKYRREKLLVTDRRNQAESEDTIYGRLARESR